MLLLLFVDDESWLWLHSFRNSGHSHKLPMVLVDWTVQWMQLLDVGLAFAILRLKLRLKSLKYLLNYKGEFGLVTIFQSLIIVTKQLAAL